MRLAIYSVLFLGLTTTLSLARALPEDSLSLPVLIKGSNGDSGTGFYLRTTSNWFLVTAKHVLFQEDGTTLRMNTVALTSYPVGKREYSDRIEYSLNLGLAASNNLIRKSASHDVAVVWMGTTQTNASGGLEIVWYSPQTTRTTTNTDLVLSAGLEILKSYTNTIDGDDAYIFGYPSSIGLKQIPQLDYNLPLLRKGVVAGKNPSQRTIVVDAPIYFGNSGGPVMEIEQTDAFTTTFRIIGIVSQFVPFIEEWENKKHKYYNITMSNSGYGIVESSDCIAELIW